MSFVKSNIFSCADHYANYLFTRRTDLTKIEMKLRCTCPVEYSLNCQLLLIVGTLLVTTYCTQWKEREEKARLLASSKVSPGTLGIHLAKDSALIRGVQGPPIRQVGADKPEGLLWLTRKVLGDKPDCCLLTDEESRLIRENRNMQVWAICCFYLLACASAYGCALIPELGSTRWTRTNQDSETRESWASRGKQTFGIVNHYSFNALTRIFQLYIR